LRMRVPLPAARMTACTLLTLMLGILARTPDAAGERACDALPPGVAAPSGPLRRLGIDEGDELVVLSDRVEVGIAARLRAIRAVGGDGRAQRLQGAGRVARPGGSRR